MYQFNPGKFRHKITFLSPPTGQDAYGAPSGTWTAYKTVYASKTPILGNEYFSANATQSDVEVKFNTRYIEATNLMRIQSGSEIYQILSAINVDSANKELLCYCKKVVE